MTKLEERMVKIYTNLIRKDEKGIEEVPEGLKEEVINALESMHGYDLRK